MTASPVAVRQNPGPDIPGIYCYTPDLCCSASPCDITEDAFICQIRTLLPEGEAFRISRPTSDPNVTVVSGATTVGCWKVGCEQMVYGGACEDVVQCSDSDGAPQLGVVDSFSATAYTYVTALCDMLRELDPCTAVVTIGDWAARFGVPKRSACEDWSPSALRAIVCTISRLRAGQVINQVTLQEIAGSFGVALTYHYAGDFNCGPSGASGATGWWSLAPTLADCTTVTMCNGAPVPPGVRPSRPVLSCETPPVSINIVMCPTEVRLPANCNLHFASETLPPDPELFEAFQWLLPQLLPLGKTIWCVYVCDPADCIV